MWPWEHLAVGYVCYSGYVRLRYGHPPRRAAVVVLAFGTQFPDLVDKPLAWQFGVLPNGLSLAHSLIAAVPIAGLAVAIGRRRSAPAVGDAFAVGYASHLLGDILYPVLRGGDPPLGFLLWPLVERPARDPEGMFGRTGDLFSEFVAFLGSASGHDYLAMELGLAAVVILLWLADGRPGLSR